MTDDVSLLDRIKQVVDSGNLTLPVYNEVAAKIQAMTISDEIDADKVEGQILADQVLVAEVLRAANSPFFGGLAEINTVRGAIVRLGVMQVSRLAVLASNRSQYDARDPSLRHLIQKLWMHASGTAMAAGWLARRLGFGKQLESESFLGGLLHDVGKLVILRTIDEMKTSSRGPYDLSSSLVSEMLSTAHAMLGFDLLKRWDVPNVYCEIARDHHAKDFDPSKIPLVIVRLANNAGAKMGLSLRSNPSIILSALPEAQCLNANDILLAELEIMIEDSLVPQ